MGFHAETRTTARARGEPLFGSSCSLRLNLHIHPRLQSFGGPAERSRRPRGAIRLLPGRSGKIRGPAVVERLPTSNAVPRTLAVVRALRVKPTAAQRRSVPGLTAVLTPPEC